MAEYSNIIRESSCSNIDDIVDLCHQLVPTAYKTRPWTHPELVHGINVLASDEALNCYMAAYGEMHVGKCRAAMMNFPFEELQGSIEIVDWGCGQGIGSATVVDVLKQHNLLQWVKRITLIEPSEQALLRAESNITKITNSSIEIQANKKYLPSNGSGADDVLTSVGYNYTNVIHIFSNILDVKTIDLGVVARMVASSHGKHFILCMGPKNSAAYRIEQFCSVFGEQKYFSKIDSVRFARTIKTGHPYTCLTRCFIYNGLPLDMTRLTLVKESELEAFDDYNLQLQIQNGVISAQKARVAWRLQNILSVDDILYVDPVVNEVSVDFIVVRPNKGVLIVNLFENNLDDCELAETSSDIIVKGKTYQSPLDLVGLCQTSIKEAVEELLISTIEDTRNYSIIKKVVIFTENSIATVKDFFSADREHSHYTYLFGNEFIFNAGVSKELFNKIGFLCNNQAFDSVVIRKLARIISPTWHSYQEGKPGLEPRGAQKKLTKSLDIHQKISGVAGSGKTFVLAARAINAMKRTGGDVLVLTYNITLANYLRYRLSEIREDFSWGKIDIYPYHQFFRIRASECKLHVGFSSYDNLEFFNEVKEHKRYSAIFVDEVQDYTTAWLKIIMQNFLLEPNGEFVVFGDPKQNVYHRPTDANGDINLGVIGGVWNRELNNGRRFTNPRLSTLATTFQTQFLSKLPVDTIMTENHPENTLSFQIVSYLDIRDSYTIEGLVEKITDIINKDHNGVSDFVVLASSRKMLRGIDQTYREKTGMHTEVSFVTTEQLKYLKEIHEVSDEYPASWKFDRDLDALDRTRKQLFTTDKRCLKISTIKSFKGWESPSVIVVLEEEASSPDATTPFPNPETIYSAITRARENLYVINIGNDSYHQFFNSQST